MRVKSALQAHAEVGGSSDEEKQRLPYIFISFPQLRERQQDCHYLGNMLLRLVANFVVSSSPIAPALGIGAPGSLYPLDLMSL